MTMAIARVPGRPFLPPAPSVITPSTTSLRPLDARLRDAVAAGDLAGLRDAVTEASRIAGSGLAPEVESALERIAEQEDLPPALRASALIAGALSREYDGDIRTATARVSRAAALEPKASTYARLITLAALSGDDASSYDLFRDGFERWGFDVNLVTAAAVIMLNRGDVEVGREWASQAIAAAPDHPVCLALAVRLALIDGDLAAAEPLARRLVLHRPSAGRAYLAIVLDAQDRLAEDRGVLEAVLADLPNDLWAELTIAAVLVRHDRLSEARAVYDRVLTRNPDLQGALRDRGVVAARQNDFDAARRDFDRLSELDPDDRSTIAMRGELARVSGDPVSAAALLGSLDPDTTENWVLLSLAAVQSELGRADEAREAYEIVLSRAPDDLQALLGLVNVELASPSDPEAVPAYGRAESLLAHARKISPSDPTTHGLYGELLRRRGEFSEALAEFDAAIATLPEWAYALASKGQVLLALGEVEPGLALLEQATACSPTTEWIVNELASCLNRYDGPHAERRLRLLQKRIRGNGGDVSLILARRISLAMDLQHYDEAERLYREARAAAPEDPQLMIGHAGVLRALGRTDDALATLQADNLTEGADDLVWERINILWELDRLDQVRTELERLSAHEDVRPSAAVLGALGELRRLEGNRVEARALLERALEAQPDYEYALSSLGAVEWQQGEAEAACRHLYQGAERGSDFALFQLVDLNSAMGNRAGLRKLADGTQGPILEASRTRIRASALRELGEYPQALQVLDDHLTGIGTAPELVLLKGFIELDLGRRRRAAGSFLSLTDSPQLGLLPAIVDGLVRVDRWPEARTMLAGCPDQAAPAVQHGIALLWAGAGAWQSALEAIDRARAGMTTGSSDKAALAAMCLRLLNRPEESVVLAHDAHHIDPIEPWIQAELAESLLAAGHRQQADSYFARIRSAMQRRVHCGADQLNLEGWSLLRLQQYNEAASVFLKTLSMTDQVAVVLFNLILATLAADEVSQANVLIHRAQEELQQLSRPIRRGVASRTMFDIASIRGSLSAAAEAEAARLQSWLAALHAEIPELDSALA